METEHATTLMLFGLLLLAGAFAGRWAARLRLPAMTGHFVAGFAIGNAGSPWLHSASETLHLLRQGLGAFLLFWIGSQLTVQRLRARRRVVLSLAAAALMSALFCAIAMALPMAGSFARSPLGTLTSTDILLAALVLSAASPTVVAVVSREQRAQGRFARSSLDATIVANAGLMLLAVATLGLGSDDRRQATSLLCWTRDVSAGLAVGGALGVLVAFGARRVPGALHVALGGVALLLLTRHVVHSDAAIMAGSFVAGAVVAHSGVAKPVVDSLEEVVPVSSAALFLVAGALVDIDLVIAMTAPAMLLFLVRAASLWVGSRLAGGLSGDALVSRFGYAALLPQAGFSLAFVGALEGPHGLSAALVSVIVVVVVMNELAMPPLVRYALNASNREPVALVDARRW